MTRECSHNLFLETSVNLKDIRMMLLDINMHSNIFQLFETKADAVLGMKFSPKSSVQFRSRWYLCTWKSAYVLHSISWKFPQHLSQDATYTG